jgi:hypothetical protein
LPLPFTGWCCTTPRGDPPRRRRRNPHLFPSCSRLHEEGSQHQGSRIRILVRRSSMVALNPIRSHSVLARSTSVSQMAGSGLSCAWCAGVGLHRACYRALPIRRHRSRERAADSARIHRLAPGTTRFAPAALPRRIDRSERYRSRRSDRSITGNRRDSTAAEYLGCPCAAATRCRTGHRCQPRIRRWHRRLRHHFATCIRGLSWVHVRRFGCRAGVCGERSCARCGQWRPRGADQTLIRERRWLWHQK